MIKTYNNEVILVFFSDSVKKKPGTQIRIQGLSGSGSGLRFWLDPDPDSMNMDPKHCFYQQKLCLKVTEISKTTVVAEPVLSLPALSLPVLSLPVLSLPAPAPGF